MTATAKLAALLVVVLSCGHAVEAYHNLEGPLLCSACEGFVREVARRHEEQQRNTGSIQVGHRLDKDNKVKYASYKDSELAAHDLLDGVCDDLRRYRLRQSNETHRRFFSNDNSGVPVDYYDDDDREELKDWSKDLEWSCNVFVDEHNDEIHQLLRAKTPADAFADAFCNKTAKVCTEKAQAKAIAKEEKRRAKWLKEKEKQERKWEKERQKEKERREKEERERAEQQQQQQQQAAEQQEGAPVEEARAEGNSNSGQPQQEEGEGGQPEGTPAAAAEETTEQPEEL